MQKKRVHPRPIHVSKDALLNAGMVALLDHQVPNSRSLNISALIRPRQNEHAENAVITKRRINTTSRVFLQSPATVSFDRMGHMNSIDIIAVILDGTDKVSNGNDYTINKERLSRGVSYRP